MKTLSLRGLVPVCAAAIGVLAIAAPGTAFAKENPLCKGDNITGSGASTQTIIQTENWTKEFNTSADKKACSGAAKPKVAYTQTSSGKGLKSWGIENLGGAGEPTINFGSTNAFLGTDEPPNASQIAALEGEESPATAKSVLTIPIMQVAVTILVHPPTGCTATSTVASGRLVISQKTLEGIYSGAIKEWGEIKDGGDSLTGSGCATDVITPVVRQDASGTTHIFKRFLNLIDTASLPTASGSHTWAELSEGSLNTVWPSAAATEHSVSSGGGELVSFVANNAGTIGYASLADARKNKAFGSEGGATKPTFWAEVQNGEKKGKQTFAEPASNGENGTQASANCKKTVYTNGSVAFPPPAPTDPWNNVTTETTEKTYAMCGFSYAVAIDGYHLLPGTDAGEAETVKAYEEFVTDKKGGQPALNVNDYEALPKSVLSIGEEGAELISF